ncbi:hypothetical protein HMPREF0281_01904 [Corynebacterium ammoniagenes DSM 20306]|uniref:Uncharacterized protein n=1 Tax=Corynebacterium ammoniagenes DSM 20306 TaxID=649754 RepID=A0ABP2IHV9_CORAM|nr:hypothetical protein HMPREF0281_01904 [Corynebacterium ammoniagenes DSM 20306]
MVGRWGELGRCRPPTGQHDDLPRCCGLPGQPEHRLLPHRPGIRRSNPCRAHPAEPPQRLPRCSPP